MLIAMLSLAGIPFTAGFFGKFLVFAAAVHEHQFMLVGVGIITVAAGFYFYLRVVSAMYWQEPNDDTPIKMSVLTRVAIGGMVALTLAAGIYPKPVLAMLRSEPVSPQAPPVRTALIPPLPAAK
jgi:NADH-quinone oxidoreductase subunit N